MDIRQRTLAREWSSYTIVVKLIIIIHRFVTYNLQA